MILGKTPLAKVQRPGLFGAKLADPRSGGDPDQRSPGSTSS